METLYIDEIELVTKSIFSVESVGGGPVCVEVISWRNRPD